MESDTPPWNASAAIASCPISPIHQAVWRGHRAKYDALDSSGSRLVSGRYHVAPNDASGGRSWAALYTSVDLAVALGEIQRNIKLSGLRDYRFTEIRVQLEAVVDCRELSEIQLLLDDHVYSSGQAIAVAAIDARAEAILMPSATRLGDNLIIFPDSIRVASVIQVVRFIDPRLDKTVER